MEYRGRRSKPGSQCPAPPLQECPHQVPVGGGSKEAVGSGGKVTQPAVEKHNRPAVANRRTEDRTADRAMAARRSGTADMAHPDNKDRGAALCAAVASGDRYHRGTAKVGWMPLAAA